MKNTPKNKISKFNKKYYKIFTIAYLTMFMFLGVAFAGHTSLLRVESMATFQAHIFDYVYITHVGISDSSNAASVQYSFLDHELNANVSATTCNGYVTYALDIVNQTPHKAFITSASVASMINGNGNSTNTLSVEFPDITPNVTSIPPHSTKTVHVKIKNNCSGSDEQVRVKANFTYSLFQYYNLTINSIPNDASISLTTSEGTYTGTGHLTQQVMETDEVSYIVTKNGYFPVTGTYTMGSANHVIDVTLDKMVTITFNANGGSVSPTEKIVAYNKPFGELPTPTKSNAIFIGWFDSEYAADSLKYYADAYGDLYNAFGYNDNSLYNHYLNNGISEGRRISQYLATDTVNFDTAKTLYAGWVYKWDKYDKVKKWDTRLTSSGDESGGFAANTYFSYTERTNLYNIINVDDGQMHFTTGEKFSVSRRFPTPHENYIYAANSDSIKTHSWTTSGHPEDVVSHYCIITGTRTTLVGYVTCDIYEVYNVRWGAGDTKLETLYSCNSSTYPDNNYSGNYWYIKS